jgi:REP element-mobilizing transposase RayT
MTLPREVIPGRFYLVTRRCTQRQFLLAPSDDVNNAFTYCLAEAANRFEIEVILPVAMSNHYHAVVFDRHGNLPRFTEHFHKMLAKTLNAMRGRWENFWASEQVCIVHLVDPIDVMRKLVYTATNPVKDHLVAAVAQWPGVNGLDALVKRQPMTATRPTHYFRADGKMPETVTLELVVPHELGSFESIVGELTKQVEVAERELAAERARSGIRVLGANAIRRQLWHSSPTTIEPRRNLRPTIAAKSLWSRIEAILRNRAFVTAYRSARKLWSVGLPASFPVGTYWLHRFASVPLDS